MKIVEQEKGEVERNLSELRAQLNRERAQWQEDLAAALQQSKNREVIIVHNRNVSLLKNSCVHVFFLIYLY